MTKKDQLKLICLALFITGFVAVLLTNNPAVRTSEARSAGPPAGHTGAPGDLGVCTRCHAGVPDTGPGRLTIIAPASYEPGQTYQITVEHATADTTRVRWGFQLTALTFNNIAERAGNLQSSGGFTTVIEGSVPTRQYISHNSTGTFIGQTGGASWTFNWTAPSTDVGPVTFYAAGNQANGTGTTAGDQIYTARVTAGSAAAALPDEAR